MTDCPLPAPKPEYDRDFLLDAWVARSLAHPKAHAIDQFARYAPELGWRAILAILEVPDAASYLEVLSDPLEVLIAQCGDQFIDRIEQEAEVNTWFRECLAMVHPSPTFPIPPHLWVRLSVAAGASIGPMAPHMAALYAELPNLAHATSWDPHPLAQDVPSLDQEGMQEHVMAWLEYHRSFWSWEELHRILAEDGPDAAWPLILDLIARGPDSIRSAVGAGVLEDLLHAHGPEYIDRVEAAAKVDAKFRYCLSHVWPGDMPTSLWERITGACGGEPQRG